MTTSSSITKEINMEVEASTGVDYSTNVAMISRNGMAMDTTDIFTALIGIIGIIDNGLVIVTILNSKSMLAKVYFKFILNQTVIDFMASIFIVACILPFGLWVVPPGIPGELYCRLWASGFLLWMILTASTLNLIPITIERYLEIVHPFSYTKYVYNKTLPFCNCRFRGFFRCYGVFYRRLQD